MTVADLLRFLDEAAPSSLAFSFDRIGLQVGSRDWPCERVAVSLDSSLGAVSFAKEIGASVLLSHHPLIWDPLSALDPSHIRTRAAMELAAAKIAFVAAHTNWDCAPDGLNDELALRLSLSDVRPFGSSNPVTQFKVVVFTPVGSEQALVEAMSKAGAGVIGDYDRCAFTSHGTGTFRGNDNSNPTIGERGMVEEVPEVRLEMVADEGCLSQVLNAVRQVHPFEEPAYDVFALHTKLRHPAGRIGRLPRPMTLSELVAHAGDRLETRSMAWHGSHHQIEKLAVVGGAADSDWRAAQKAGAQAFLTGEIKQNVALEGSESGLAMIAAGHYATEHPGCDRLCRRLTEAGFDALLYTPEPGQSGRPLI